MTGFGKRTSPAAPLELMESAIDGPDATAKGGSEDVRRIDALMALVGMAAETPSHSPIDVERFLELGCRYFDVELGLFLRSGEDRKGVEAIAGDLAAALSEGRSDPDLEAWTISIERSEGWPEDAPDLPAAHLQTPRGLVELRTALILPVQGSAACYGTLCLADRRQRPHVHDSQDLQVLRFMATWLANGMDAAAAKRSYEEANLRLSASEERYRSLYEKTPAMLHSIDERGLLASVSDAWLATMGYERDDVVGRPSTDFLTPESRRYAKEVALPAFLDTGRCSDVAYQFVTKDGDVRDILLSAISHTRDDGSFLQSLAVLHDVTDRRRIERILASQTAALERSHADLARFTHIASHDLQEPLRRIIGYCEILKQDHSAELSEDAARIADIIQSGGRRLRLIIDDLLTYVRVREQLDHAFEPVDMFAIIHQVLEDLNADIGSTGARIDVAHLPLVWGRAPLLKMVVHHLLYNALRHGGSETPEIDITVEDAGEFWQFALSDRGHGVEPRHADRIFEIFERLHHKDEREGSGTGLAICRLIIERCGGRIWLDPTYSEGARFLFTLPKEKPDSLIRLPEDAPMPPSRAHPALT